MFLKNNFNEVWKEYYPGLTIFVSNMVRHAKLDVEDLVQDIMLKAYNNLHRYNRSYRFSTWLYSIARNHCIDALRKEETNRKTISAFQSEMRALNSSHDCPEQILFGKTIESCIRVFIESLAPEDQQIAFLRFYEGIKYRVIADIVGLPSGTVKYRVHLLRKELKRELKIYMEPYNV